MAQDIIKNIPLVLDINARKRLNGTVDIQLYSKDIATGQFEFTFIDEDGNPVVLDETYSAQALVRYEGDSNTYLDDMTIEGNIIRFIFPYDFIIKDGTIKMYIYVTKDNYTSDVAAISFPVFVSEIDQGLDPSVVVHYIGKIEQLIEDLKDELASYQVDVDEIIEGYEESISRLQAIETDYEPQLTSLTAQLAQTRQQKADKSYVDTLTQSIASGSPKGTYATLLALQTAYPTGNSNIYVVNADGGWYYWNGNSWTKGGIYQSAILSASNSVITDSGNFYNATNVETALAEVATKFTTTSIVQETSNFTWVDNKYIGVYGAVSDGVVYKYAEIQLNTGDELTVNYDGLTNTIAIISEWLNNVFVRTIEWTSTTDEKTVVYKAVRPMTVRVCGRKDKIFNVSLKYRSTANYSVAEEEIKTTCNKYAYGIETPINIVGNNVGGVLSYGDITSHTLYRHSDKMAFTKGTKIACRVGGIAEGTTSIISKWTSEGVFIESVISGSNDEERYYTVQDNTEYLVFSWRIDEKAADFVTVSENPKYEFFKTTHKETLPRTKLITLGDSITAPGTTSIGWIKYFIEKTNCELVANVAVSGAVLADYSDTGAYDGNPVSGNSNVLGNQVQKIINNNYEAPDIIMIAIGTNHGIDITESDMHNVYVESDWSVVPLENVDRKTHAGAYRYALETLHNLYPNAIIMWCTPILGHQTVRSAGLARKYAESLKIATEYTGQIMIDTIRCGINTSNEFNGSEGEYLVDGLHPNAKGAKRIGYYNASKVLPIIQANF